MRGRYCERSRGQDEGDADFQTRITQQFWQVNNNQPQDAQAVAKHTEELASILAMVNSADNLPGCFGGRL